MDEVYRQWGRNISERRKAVGFATQEQFAGALGVRQSTVARWERGEIAPRDHHKVAIAQLLAADVWMIFPLTRGVA